MVPCDRLLFEFLCRVYELADGNSASVLDARSAGQELGMLQDEIESALESLTMDQYIERATDDPRDVRVRITEDGMEEVEDAISQPYRRTHRFAPLIDMYPARGGDAIPLREARARATGCGEDVVWRLYDGLVSGRIKPVVAVEEELPPLRFDVEPAPARAADYVKFRYRTQYELRIPGEIIGTRNVLALGGNENAIADASFLLLLRLVVELKRGEGGWVNRHSLASEGVVADAYGCQPYSNLKAAIGGCLPLREGADFIENDGRKSYRISTHPDFVIYDKERLLLHPNHSVTELAELLP